MAVIFVIISFLASTIGSICGIGGGVMIKPVLDAFHAYSVGTISFMSSCIVLAMATYSVANARASGVSMIRKGVGTFLGVGAAFGGIIGKNLFDFGVTAAHNADAVGAIQAAALLVVTLATLLFSLKKKSISPHQIENRAGCAGIGLALGILSSFLGIGGGPINLVVLYYFFSMSTKEAAQNSLYVILLSQLFGVGYTILTGGIPELPTALLAAMILCGVLGGMAGRKINAKIQNKTLDRLFVGLLVFIMAICCYNFYQFFKGL